MSQPDNRALLRHIVEQKLLQMRRSDAARRAAAGLQPDAAQDGAAGLENLQMTETRIYVGLNDAETRQQEYETEKYLDELKEVCRSYRVAFSLDIEQGGYYHEDGEYTEETSLVLLLIDADRDLVRRIARDLRARFRQESVLVTEDRIAGFFVSEDPA